MSSDRDVIGDYTPAVDNVVKIITDNSKNSSKTHIRIDTEVPSMKDYEDKPPSK